MNLVDTEVIDGRTSLEFGERAGEWYLVQYGEDGTDSEGCLRVSIDYLTAEDARNAIEFGTVSWGEWD